jgi:hypothetical protein
MLLELVAVRKLVETAGGVDSRVVVSETLPSPVTAAECCQPPSKCQSMIMHTSRANSMPNMTLSLTDTFPLACRQPQLLQPPLKRSPYLRGHCWYGRARDHAAQLRAAVRNPGTSPAGGKVKARPKQAFTIHPGRSKSGPDEANGFIAGSGLLAYHPKTGR